MKETKTIHLTREELEAAIRLWLPGCPEIVPHSARSSSNDNCYVSVDLAEPKEEIKP